MLTGMRHTVVLVLGLVLLVVACGGTSPAEEYLLKGNGYVNTDDYEKAVQEYDEAIRLNPQLVFAYNNRGNAYYYLGQYERAIQDYDEAIRLDWGAALAYRLRGRAYGYLGQQELADRDFATAKSLGVE